MIAIANSRVNKIPYTELASPNPWFDQLRRITFDEQNEKFIIATLNGFYYSDDNFKSKLKKFDYQPPASVMGVTVFEKRDTNTYLIGSFEGLFLWNYKTGDLYDYIKKETFIPPVKKTRPIGEYLVSGYTKDYKNQEIFFEYNIGAININNNKNFVSLPKNIIKESPISLWNVALEVHTGRIFQFIFGDFYILIIPLVGLTLLFILISGFVVWYKLHRNKQKNNIISIIKHNTMNKNNYKVNDECISCRACVEVAKNNFAMGETGLAYVKNQPSNEKEKKQVEEALEICPVAAIEKNEVVNLENDKKPILATSNIKETLDEYPKLKNVLVDLSPKFKKILNPVMYNTLAKYASFNDAAKVTKTSICEILHSLNSFIGTEKQLQKIAPDCIKTDSKDDFFEGSEITWNEPTERYIYNVDSMSEIIEKIANLNAQESIVIISVEEPSELIKSIQGLGYEFNAEKHREYRVSIFNPETDKIEIDLNWQKNKESFERLDVRTMQTDPFDIIIKKAYEIEEGNGFILIQRFEPYPLMNMLSEMGYDYVSERHSVSEFRVYFYKVPEIIDKNAPKTEKTDVIIQSATPVAYPVIMRLLQSEVIRKSINIRELKVWEETEKHLAWITTGKADISFSALITAAKLRNSDIKIPAMFVWDNFVMLTRYKAEKFEDVKGKDIHTPLFEEAPPAKITKYLIKASGLNTEDFNFVFGKPFGRPEKIYEDFVTGIADTAILREPEASYAIKIMKDRNEEISVIPFNKIWNDINPGFGSFPNAGIVLKGEFARNNPELTKVFLEELKKAINWVNENRIEAANLAFDMMRQPVDRIGLFLERVNFEYVSDEILIEKVKAYFDILIEQGIVETEIDDEFYDIFRLNK